MNNPHVSDILDSTDSAVLFLTQDREDILKKVLEFVAAKECDRLVYDVKLFGVDEAETLSHESRTASLRTKYCVISAGILHWVAQNKILKALEDSHTGVRFIFILESLDSVLPTILSRMQLCDLSFENEVSTRAKLFLTTKKTSRMDLPFLKKLLALKDKDDKKDREESLRFLRELYTAVSLLSFDSRSQEEVLSFLFLARSPSASFKMIFEYLALRLPSVVE